MTGDEKLGFFGVLWRVLQVKLDRVDDLLWDDVWGWAWVESDSGSSCVGNLDCATYWQELTIKTL